MIGTRDDLTLGTLSLTYRVSFTGFLLVVGLGSVSYTHLTLPTNREV